MAKPAQGYVPGTNVTPNKAYEDAVRNAFPTANPTLPKVLPDGGIVTPGQAYVPAEPGMGSGPGGTGSPTPPAPPSTGSGSGSGSGNANQPLDWHAYLTNWGFSQDIVDELDRIFRTYSDPSQASAAAIAYIRGTDWYNTTFPGIQAGMKLGVINNEQDYRAYTNQVNDLYNRYYGRNVSGNEVASLLSKGYSVGREGQALSGEAWAKANGADVQYLLGAFDQNGQATGDQLQALGEENSGLDSLLGQQLQQRLSKAQDRLRTIMSGTLATPSLSLLNSGRPASPSLAAGNNATDVAS